MNGLRCMFGAIALLWSVPTQSFAQDTGIPDTLYYGDHGQAYGYPGGIFKIPIYVSSDEPLCAVVHGMEYNLQTSGIVYDSLSKFGSIFMQGPYFQLGLLANTASIDGTPTDTLGIAAICINTVTPAGRYKLCDVFFHGANIGDVVTVDSAAFPPTYEVGFLPNGSMGQLFIPQFVTQPLTVVPAPADMFVTTPLTAEGDAGTQIQFDVAVTGAHPPVSIALDSLCEPATDSCLMTLPPTFGSNPVTTVWTPTAFQDGIWIAYFTATDNQLNTLPIEVTITVNWVPASCEVLRGDANCDGVVNVADAVAVILYIFAGGAPPGCSK